MSASEDDDIAPDPATLCASAGHYLDEATGAVIPPIHPTTTFARNADYGFRGGHDYGRDDDPTLKHAERVIAALEGAGVCRLFPSGMAAITAWLRSFPPGAILVAPRRAYYGVTNWLKVWSETSGRTVRWYDPADFASLEIALGDKADALWVETPANPTWDVLDLKAAVAAATAAGAVVGVDNTVPTPLATRPLDLGAEASIHSATKYLNGHSDVLIGAICMKDPDHLRFTRLAWERKQSGHRPSAWDAWLLLRGLRTFPLRFERQCASALHIATALQSHPKVARVLYPGLADHPNHTVAKVQMNGRYSGVLSILIEGDAAAAKRMILGLDRFHPATSIGGVESLAEYRPTVEGPTSGLPENLVRLSIGLEDPRDLLADIDQALEQAP